MQSVGSVDDVDYHRVRFGDERCDPSLPRPTRAHQSTPTSVRADWWEGFGAWDNLHRFILPTDCNPVSAVVIDWYILLDDLEFQASGKINIRVLEYASSVFQVIIYCLLYYSSSISLDIHVFLC